MAKNNAADREWKTLKTEIFFEMRIEENDIERVLIDEEAIKNRVKELAEQIDRDYAGHKLMLVCILKGSFVFFADLARSITLPVEIEFMRASSYYSGTSTTGQINIRLDLTRDDLGKYDILIVEDIIDSGRTLSLLVDYLKKRGAGSVATCTLLDKPGRREVNLSPDYRGFTIPDEFVVGYGLDFDEKYRNVPYVGVLSPSAYSGK